MSVISECVQKIENELLARESKLSDALGEVSETKKKQAAKAKELTLREKELAEAEKPLVERENKVSALEGAFKLKEDTRALKMEAEAYMEEGRRQRKAADEVLAESKQKLAELEKRELALVREKAEYKERVEKEILTTFLNRK